MGVISTLLIVIFILTAVLLVVLVLLQDEQGEGLGGIFGGGSSTPFGSRGGNVLTRFTSILGAIFLFCSFGIAWINRSPQTGDVLGAAKRSQSQQGTAWWLNNPTSDAQLPAGNGTTPGAAPGSSAQGGAPSSSATSSAPAESSPQSVPTPTGAGTTVPTNQGGG